jgi:hypothetical protein
MKNASGFTTHPASCLNDQPDNDPAPGRARRQEPMNKLMKTATAVALLVFAQAALACDYPERVGDLPDGITASRDDMIAGKKAVQSYLAAMEAYLSCIEAEEAQAVLAMGKVDDDTKRQRKNMFDKKYNAAVEEMNLVAEQFNIQLRAYNAKKKN